MTVVIRAGRILTIGHTGSVRVPGNAQVLSARGKFLIPGLWDMHAHTGPWGRDTGLSLYIANGITGIRDMGGELETIQKWRGEIALGTTIGPRIFAAGRIVDGPTPDWPFRITVRNPDESRKAVRSLKQGGADFVKVHARLSRESYFAIADEAKKQGMSFAGHIPWTVRAAEASDAGQKSIEHLNESQLLIDCSSKQVDAKRGPGGLQQYIDTYDEEKCRALMDRFRRNGTWQVPTLVTLRTLGYLADEDYTRSPLMKYLPKEMKEFWQAFMEMFMNRRTKDEWDTAKRVFRKDLEVVGAMQRAGVGLLAGTDAAVPSLFPGFSLHDEVALLVQAGLSPMEALQAATRNPATYLGLLESLGTVEEGKFADLVLLNANPLQEIRNTQRIHAVVAGGRLLDRKTLDRILSQVERMQG